MFFVCCTVIKSERLFGISKYHQAITLNLLAGLGRVKLLRYKGDYQKSISCSGGREGADFELFKCHKALQMDPTS
jgi:hypothetical protein